DYFIRTTGDTLEFNDTDKFAATVSTKNEVNAVIHDMEDVDYFLISPNSIKNKVLLLADVSNKSEQTLGITAYHNLNGIPVTIKEMSVNKGTSRFEIPINETEYIFIKYYSIERQNSAIQYSFKLSTH
ncbi:MAG: hypothetical protein HY606_06280, partial [Planctomycetes bacterium]|nr:hypothetical protein [Planctomycetota bacterium]